MRIPRSFQTLFATLWGFASLAQADVLFVDLNLSQEEVHAVKTSLTPFHERVVAYPTLPQKEKLPELRRVYESRAQAYKKISELTRKDKPNENKPQIISLKADVARYTKIIRDILGINFFSWEKFVSLLQKLQDDKRHIDTLIISGHSLGQDFWGIASDDLKREALISSLNAYPSLFEKLDAILLWGCYTGTLENLAWWNSLTLGSPRKVWIGFLASGPATTSDETPELLKQILAKKSALEGVQSPREFGQWFYDLSPEVKDTTMSALLKADENTPAWFGSVKQKFAPISQSLPDCMKAPERLAEGLRLYQNFVKADKPGFANPPEDIHHSPLRKFYDQIQSYQICKDYVAPDMSPYFDALPTPLEISALIHFPLVQQSFYREHEADLKKAKATLSSHRQILPLALDSLQSGSWTRRQLQEWLNSFPAKPAKTLADIKALIQDNLLDFKSIPARWITGH